MDRLRLEHHLDSPQGRNRTPRDAFTGRAGGAACCDRVSVSLSLEGDLIADAGFRAHGCGAAHAAASAVVTLTRGRPLLEVARIGAGAIAAELGGLSPGKLHAAELAAEALHRALGSAAIERAVLGRPASGRSLVAMSGGVDSAVAGLLAARAGEVVAVTLELWAESENDAERSCCSASAVRQARALAHSLGLAHLTIDLRAEFRAGVVDPFLSAHAAGETPNPCVRCNGNLRLDALLALAGRLGADRLLTGHYARIAESSDWRGPLLRVAADATKDQTYMLAALAPGSLRRMGFPLGDLTKQAVRAIAADARLAVAAKPDSQDLCFLAGTDNASFLARHGGLGERRGELVDQQGVVLGSHPGQHRYTVGQRRGIGLGLAEPLYVLAKDAASNRVTVGPKSALLTRRVAVRAARLHRPGARVNQVKLRYRSAPARARLLGDPGAGRHSSLTVDLAEGVGGAAPGQLACLMDGELVVGWGTIAS